MFAMKVLTIVCSPQNPSSMPLLSSLHRRSGSIICLTAAALMILLPARAELLVKPGDHVALCGDILSADAGYTSDVEAYLLASQQAPNLLSKQFGWSAQSPGDFMKVLKTDLLPFQPTVVTLFYGFGDNGTATPDPTALAQRKQNLSDLIDALKKNSVRVIVLGSPVAVDSQTYHNDPAKAALFNQALGVVAAADKQLAADKGVVYADVFEETLAAMTKIKANPNIASAVKFNQGDPWSMDGITKVVIAGAFLKALGCDGDIGGVTVDFAANQAQGEFGTKVIGCNDWTVSVEQVRPLFYYPGSGANDPLYPAVMAQTTFNHDLNRFTLTIKNLPTPRAKIYWGQDYWHDYTAEELARGVNLSANMFGPTVQKFSNLLSDLYGHESNGRVAAQAIKDNTTPKVSAVPDDDYKKAVADSATPIEYTIKIVPLADYELKLPQPVNIIFDTDMNGDCDDVGAAALLGSFANRGEAKLLAGGIDNPDVNQSSGATLHAIWKYYGFPDVPIGNLHGTANPNGSAYTKKIHQQFDPDYPDNDKLPDAVDVYRKALAAAPDGSVTIVNVGPMPNIWALYDSKPDAASPLAGVDLIKQKVRKLVVMANTMKGDGPYIMKWPTPILWTIEIGNDFRCGHGMQTQPDTDPAKLAYECIGSPEHNCLTDGQQAWDPSAAWIAVRGPGDLFDVTWGGYWKVDDNGSYGPWVNGPPVTPEQNRIITKMQLDWVGNIFDKELARVPTNPPASP
jgi:RNase H-fold protein (predicted Holliday junction resolvase)